MTDNKIHKKSPTTTTDAQYKQRVYDKIVQAYSTEKGKGFVNHLITAFIDDSKVAILHSTTEKIKCALTGIPIVSESGLWDIAKEKSEEIIKYFDPKSLHKNPDLPNIYYKELRYTQPAIASTDSGKMLSVAAYQMLCKFVNKEVASGNKSVAYLISFVKAEKQKARNVATFNLADNPNLKKLKEKFKK